MKERDVRSHNDQEVRIHDEHDYQRALQALGSRSRPSWLLRLLMNALEGYRQKRKMGWSRPQNKQGLTVFSAYELSPSEDEAILAQVFTAANQEFAEELGAAEHAFLEQLRLDAGLMGFLFVHDLVEGERRFEGLTYSLGRRVPGEPRFRDRFDLIVESEVAPQGSVGFTRVRAYVDPFRKTFAAHPVSALCHEPALSTAMCELFALASRLHGSWSSQQEKHWRHWTSDYIDYFGPRANPVANTHFPTLIDAAHALRSAG